MKNRIALCLALCVMAACTELDAGNAPPHRANLPSRSHKAGRPPIADRAQIAAARDHARTQPVVPPEPREPHVYSATGSIRRVDGEPVTFATHDAIAAMVWFETGADGHLVFDFPQDGRVEIEPQTRFAIGEDRPMQLILASGAVHGVLVPIGNAPRAPMRIATMSSTSEITGSGDVFVSTNADGHETKTTVLLGEISIYSGAREGNSRPTAVRAHAGQAATTTVAKRGEAIELVASPAATTLASLRSSRRRVPRMCASSSRDSEAAALATSVTEALAHGEANLAAQRELDTRHRAATGRDQAQATGMMLQIATQAQLVARDRQAMLTLWEQATALAGCAPASWQPTFAPLRPRARTLLGTD